VPELALDDDQRQAFVRHLNGVRVSVLMRREPPPHPRSHRRPRQLFAGR
jgi:hypothetical protein